jgi:hypothetical protein
VEHGTYPARTEDLVGQYLISRPLDPFDGKPLRMRAHNAGIVLYSVGQDLEDDGGTGPYFIGATLEDRDEIFCLGDAYRELRRERALQAEARGREREQKWEEERNRRLEKVGE